jgi:hypothetical protein
LEQNHLSPWSSQWSPERTARLGGAHVGAGEALGHEHGALQLAVEVFGQKARQVAIEQLGIGEAADGAGQAVGHVDRAQQPELGLGEKVGERILAGRRQRLAPAQRRPVRQRRQRQLAEGQALHVPIGRRLDDGLAVLAGAGPGLQARRHLVGLAREIVEAVADEPAQPLEMGLHVAQLRLRQVEAEQRLQRPVRAVEVEPARFGRRRGMR